jgi:hypothetical protein
VISYDIHVPNMEQPATAPATSNAIRGAEQSGNIVKQRFAGMVEVRGCIMTIWEADKQVVGSET